MKKHILHILFAATNLAIGTTASAWSWGGLDVKEMKKAQEEAYQAGKSCQRGDKLDSCSVYIEKFKNVSALLKKHEDEIREKLKEGDPDYEQIRRNFDKLLSLSRQLSSR